MRVVDLFVSYIGYVATQNKKAQTVKCKYCLQSKSGDYVKVSIKLYTYQICLINVCFWSQNHKCIHRILVYKYKWSKSPEESEIKEDRIGLINHFPAYIYLKCFHHRR